VRMLRSVEAFKKTHRVAVGTFIWRGKTTPIAIRVHQDGLMSARPEVGGTTSDRDQPRVTSHAYALRASQLNEANPLGDETPLDPTNPGEPASAAEDESGTSFSGQLIGWAWAPNRCRC